MIIHYKFRSRPIKKEAERYKIAYNFRMGILCREFDPVTKCGSEFGKIFPSIIVYFLGQNNDLRYRLTVYMMVPRCFRIWKAVLRRQIIVFCERRAE